MFLQSVNKNIWIYAPPNYRSSGVPAHNPTYVSLWWLLYLNLNSVLHNPTYVSLESFVVTSAWYIMLLAWQFLSMGQELFWRQLQLHCNCNYDYFVTICYAMISSHNKSQLIETKTTNATENCNCRQKSSCPMERNCQANSIIYQAEVTTKDCIIFSLLVPPNNALCWNND